MELLCLFIVLGCLVCKSYQSSPGFESPKCSGKRQSPIVLDMDEVKQQEMEILQLKNYDDLLNLTLVNTGHVVQLTVPEASDPLILRGGKLEHDYHLKQFHFHWGENDTLGSEHMIHGRHYPMEMHLVHSKNGLPLKTALIDPNAGLAVLGILFQLESSDNPIIESLLTHFESIKSPGSVSATVPGFSIGALVPHGDLPFFTYSGSLTTYPCTETVIWTVLSDFIGISSRQMARFRELLDFEGNPIVHNYRPLELRYDRPIYQQIPESKKMKPFKQIGMF